MHATRRQQIAEILHLGPLTVPEIARKLGTTVKNVVDDLEHVRRSVMSPERWIMEAAECLGCGFAFRGRDRINRPSRCPRCKSEEIQEARYEIQSEWARRDREDPGSEEGGPPAQ